MRSADGTAAKPLGLDVERLAFSQGQLPASQTGSNTGQTVWRQINLTDCLHIKPDQTRANGLDATTIQSTHAFSKPRVPAIFQLIPGYKSAASNHCNAAGA